MGIASFCLITVFALLPMGVANDKETVDTTVAAGIAAQVIADLRVNPTATSSPHYSVPIPKAGGATTITTTLPAAQILYFADDGSYSTTLVRTGATPSLYRVSVGYAPPPTGKTTATILRVFVSWPAVADTTTAWPSKYKGSYELITALDRN